MPDVTTGFDWNELFIAVLAVLAVAGLIVSLLFSRHSITHPNQSEYGSFKADEPQKTRESLLYCIGFFNGIYKSKAVPDKAGLSDFRLRSSAAAGSFRDTHSAFIKHCLRGSPLPGYTEEYKNRLKRDGREGDVLCAFCLYAGDELSRLADEADTAPGVSGGNTAKSV